MERLSIHDPPPAATQQSQQQPPQQQQQNLGSASMVTQGPPQLPPQMFTTAAQLLDLTDSKCGIWMWKGGGKGDERKERREEKLTGILCFREAGFGPS